MFFYLQDIDQSPIGRTPRSNPATYTGAFGPIRDWFTSLPESKTRGYKPGRFSFNVKGGRCEACEGDGVITYEMHFLPDVYIQCDECKGTRYNRETLEIKFKGKSIADVLDMSVDEGCEYFENISNIKTKLLILINHPLEEPLDQIQQHTQGHLVQLEIGLLVYQNQKLEVINQEDFHLTSKVEDVKLAKVTV